MPRSGNLIQALWGLALLLLVGGCQGTPMIGANTPQEDLDQERSATYPSDEEIYRPASETIAFLPVQQVGKLSRYHRAVSVAFVQSTLEEFSGFQILADQRVLETLSLSQFRSVPESCRLQASEPCIEAALGVGRYLKADYIALMRLTPSPVREAENDWSTYVTLKIHRVDPEATPQLRPTKRLDEELTFVSSQAVPLRQEFGQRIRKAFPIQGFILETRGGRAYALINLGEEHHDKGIVPGATLSIYRRSYRATAESGPTQVAFDRVGHLSLVNVLPQTAWGIVPEEFRDAIRSGDVVQVEP